MFAANTETRLTMTEQIYSETHESLAQNDTITIGFTSKKNWPAIIFLTGWLGIWGIGAMNMIFITEYFFLTTLGLTAWAIGGMAVFYFVLWQLFGEEVIHVEDGKMTLERTILGIGPKRSFEIQNIDQIRIEPSASEDTEPPIQDSMSGLMFFLQTEQYRFASERPNDELYELFDLLKSNINFSDIDFVEKQVK